MWRFDLIPDNILPDVFDAIQKKNWRLVATYFQTHRVTSFSNCGSCIDWGEFVLWCELAIEEKLITKDPKERQVYDGKYD